MMEALRECAGPLLVLGFWGLIFVVALAAGFAGVIGLSKLLGEKNMAKASAVFTVLIALLAIGASGSRKNGRRR